MINHFLVVRLAEDRRTGNEYIRARRGDFAEIARFNPATPLSYLDYVMDKLDVILLMSVNPGFGGQSFIPQTLDKLREVRQRIDASGYDIRLEVDGGVKASNIGEIAAAGADMFVAGSAIFGQPDYKKVIDQMRSELAKVSHG